MSIRATIRGGRLETEQSFDLKDGTEVNIAFVDDTPECEAAWDNSPEGIAAWLAWADSLEPLIFTEAERNAWDSARRDRKVWEQSQLHDYSERLKGMWQ